MHKYAPSNAADAFDPFDIEHCQEEAVWIMTLASLHMPDIFALSKFANVLLAYTNGPRLLVMVCMAIPPKDAPLFRPCSISPTLTTVSCVACAPSTVLMKTVS